MSKRRIYKNQPNMVSVENVDESYSDAGSQRMATQ